MKNSQIFGIFILLVIFAVILALVFSRVSNDDELMGEQEVPVEELPSTDNKISYLGGKAFIEEVIVIDGFSEAQVIDDQVILTGRASGTLAFEGDFPVHVEDASGNIIAWAPARFTEEWMTTELVPFEAVLHIVYTGTDTTGFLVFENSNPSGLPEHAQRYEIPITLIPAVETMTTVVYFPNSNRGSDEDCSKVFPVERTIPKTTSVGRVSLYELIKGPTSAERELGFSSPIGMNTQLLELAIDGGVAYVDFSRELSSGGSCAVGAIRAQIEQTLKQFPTVTNVTIAVEGNTAEALQP